MKRVLIDAQGKYKTILIITDGVSPMDGDLAKLPEITAALAENYNALTYVDDTRFRSNGKSRKRNCRSFRTT